MEDKKFEELFELEESKEINVKIKKSINKRIYVRIIITILSFCLIVAGITFGIHFYKKNTNYNPFEENIDEMFIKYAIENNYQEKDIPNLYQEFLIQTYVNLNMAGYEYVDYGNMKDIGFGKYELNGKIVRAFHGFYENETIDQYFIEESKNKLDKTVPRLMFVGSAERKEGNELGYLNYRHIIDEYKNNYTLMLDEIKKMPDSSQFEIYVTYETAIPLVNWNSKTIPNYDYQFAATTIDDENICDYVGFDVDYLYYDEIIDMTYDSFYVQFESATSEDFYKHYETLLMIMSQHSEFLETFEWSFDNELIEFVNEELEKVKQRNVDIIGYVAYVSKEELLEILEDSNTYYVKIRDVKYSSFENDFSYFNAIGK